MTKTTTRTQQQLSMDDFLRRAGSISGWQDLTSLRHDAMATENLYRELFARCRESWEVPEVDDPFVFLVKVFSHSQIFTRLSRYEQDTIPRCFPLEQQQRQTTSAVDTSQLLAITPSTKEFQVSWDCLTEGLLRFLDWNHVFCAGGAVAGCLAPLPDEIASAGPAATRVQRRKYYHDTFLPGSDIDLFLYGLDPAAAEGKLLEIFDAVQAANPYEIRTVRSAHALTLISQYPFRHVQIVLRLYNSPSEVLMGFDVDACAVGYDGQDVYCCPRTALALKTQANIIDLSRRSPSYEMRLAKYAQRGFEVIVPGLDRTRVDPFLYEKRFDQTKGLSRLLLLERLRTPEERLRYRLQSQLKTSWQLEYKLRKVTRERHNLYRAEGTDGIVLPVSGPEQSDYSTVFLPWGPEWNAARIEKVLRKKDKLLNKIQFQPNGKVDKSRRSYKIHVCAVGTMAQVIGDPFPDDPPIPPDTPAEELEGSVSGRLTWLIDNPGRQQIGSFHPITDDDWKEGAYFSKETEELIRAAIANDAEAIESLLATCESEQSRLALLLSRDFLGRSALHVATLADSRLACQSLLRHADHEFLKARLPDGRNALHLAAMRGNVPIISLIIEKKNALGDDDENALDIDGADWEVKMSPLQYAVVMGHVDAVKVLLSHAADARKIAVHKDKGKSASTLSLLAHYSTECGKPGSTFIKPILDLLLQHGASPTQVDTNGSTCWHQLAASPTFSSLTALNIFLEAEASTHDGIVRGLNIIDSRMQSPIYNATVSGNARAISVLLKYGASPVFEHEDWQARLQQSRASGGNRYYVDTRGISGETLRCPIALAAQNADVPSLRAFLSHDASLANVIIYSQNSRRQRVAGQSDNQEEVLRPLDLLNRTYTVVRGDVNSEKRRAARMADLERSVSSAEDKVRRANHERKENADDPYKSHVWSLVARRESEILEVARFQAKQGMFTEQDEHDEEKAIQQVEEARRTLLAAKGTYQESEADQQDDSSHLANYRRKDELLDPFQSINEMTSIGFVEAANMPLGYARYQNWQTNFTSREHKNWLALMSAASGSSEDAVQTAASAAKVCIVDSFGNTPLFLSVRARSLKSVKIIFECATKQFKAHVLEQERLMLLQQQRRAEELRGRGVEANSLKAQLRRLNNLDIAAGETPQDSGPTPDEMRQRLETSEAAALQQATAGSSTDVKPVSSVSPEALLLQRAVVAPHESTEPQLASLKRRLAREIPTSFSEEWVCHPTRLRPLELAIVRADIEMVTALVQLATEISEEDCINVGGISDDELSKGSVNSSQEGSEYSDDEVVRSNRAAAPMGLSQLRYLLAGEASGIPDFGGMTLVQLAIAVDNIDIFSIVVCFARENTLPRGAIAIWKTAEENAIDKPEETKEEIRVILGDSSPPNSRLRISGTIPVWSVDGRGSSSETHRPHTTPLQFALSLGSEQVGKAILSGAMDNSLLCWITRSRNSAELEEEFTKLSVSRDDIGGMKAVSMAAAWIIRQVRQSSVSEEELVVKLVRPTALDSAGRTALFYAKACMIEDVVASAVQATSGQSNSRALFLETVTRRGSLTALMAACSAGQVERVRALLKGGCQRSYACGPKHWGPVHLAIPSEPKTCVNGAKRWAVSREIIVLLLDGISDTETEQALVSPKAEHTPLMLAADRGADKETFSLLLSKANKCAKLVLSTRDSELNSTLHIAARRSLEKGNFVSEPEDSSLACAKVLLSRADAPDALGPCVENSRGVTPAELALEHITHSVWDRLQSGHNAGRLQYIRGGESRIQQRRRNVGKGPLPPPVPVAANLALEGQNNTWDYSLARRVLLFFKSEERDGVHGWKERLTATFNEVQGAKKQTANKARSSTATTSSLFCGDDHSIEAYQSEPSGPPAVLAISSSGNWMRGLDEDVARPWNGWSR